MATKDEILNAIANERLASIEIQKLQRQYNLDLQAAQTAFDAQCLALRQAFEAACAPHATDQLAATDILTGLKDG